MKLVFNPLTGKFDEVVSKSSEVNFNGTGTAPEDKADGWYEADEYSGNGYVYFFANGNRYRIDAILDNAAASFLLLETGDKLLLENGDKLILE